MDIPKKLVPLDMSKVTPKPSARRRRRPEPWKSAVIAALRTVYDPELPVNLYELGLIYELKIEPTGEVHIRMTLTSPGCPVAGSLVGEVQKKVEAVSGVRSAKVELVWDPPWDKSRMSEAALLDLGLM